LDGPTVLTIDDTLAKKWGRRFEGLGLYRDPTDKHPGAERRESRAGSAKTGRLG
jgi:hypothetical protein